ncbi:hypothetical protein BN1200_1850004 [Klebsiella variicola]|nr:hypothetical protein BN1200_1850004 [Klebsiella variicola]
MTLQVNVRFITIQASILTGTTQHWYVDGVLMSESNLPQPKSGISKDTDRNPTRVDNIDDLLW